MNKTLTALVIASTIGCGGEHPPIPNKQDPCDEYAFVTGLKGPFKTVDIDCRIIRSEGDWETQLFTVHDNGETRLSYWANSKLVKVEGKAPDCILRKFAEPVPRPPLKPADCKSTVL